MSSLNESAPGVVVLVPTYRRTEQLQALLSALQEQSVPPGRIVVCDNDPGRSAQGVSEAHGVEYCADSTPGVVAVRNALLSRVHDDDELIAFIDDDELPPGTWLATMVGTMRSEDVDVVGGPVVPRYPADADHWTIRQHAHEHGTRARGVDRRLYPSTNNCLLSHRAWRAAGALRFDAAFAASGGEDTDFFWRLRRAGLSFFWEPSAIVHEHIPVTRLTTRWIIRRGMQNGWVHATLLTRGHPPAVVLIHGLARIASGTAQLLLGTVRGRFDLGGARRVLAGVGFLRAVAGSRPSAYARPIDRRRRSRPER